MAASVLANMTGTGGVFYVPAGEYVITSTVVFSGQASNIMITVKGDGLESNILWAADTTLFSLTDSVSTQFTMQDFMITVVGGSKSASSWAILVQDAQRGIIDHVHIMGSNGNYVGGGINLAGVADSCTVRDVQMWLVQGTGIMIGYGSEIRISGGRIIGIAQRQNNPGIGVRVTGNNGGVHIDSTDLIALGTGLVLDSSNGHGSNREIFLTHATLDSNNRGLAIFDNSYVSIAGLWAASSDIDNIWIDVGTTALLSMSGGTIFNAGTYGCTDPSTMCNGLTANSGSFALTGVEIRNNQGRGIWIPNSATTQYSITGCRIFSNGQGLDLAGTEYSVTGNICSGNVKPNAYGGTGNLVANNLAC
eukprot:TRINITY_DN6536_c0_g1_i2.p1 TRINITY_DN6536_c0_g1~~TRINITY_DN6536_c0_g1_i2.p1  ORF type:complete len:418 (+),score=92.47 TRINITY_DN6536_c0_g1_i2:168-1256(+)